MKEKKLIIIDSNSVIHRAFHALPPLSTKSGERVNVVYGFLLVLFRAIKDFQPDYIAAAFDLPKPTFRHAQFKEYKGKRPPTPADLSSQIPKVKEILGAFNIPIFEKEGFEADDIIGTIANQKNEAEVIILSGDLDSLQLVSSKVKIYFLRKGVKDTVLYDKDRVKEKYQGLDVFQVVDYKALRGDASDNIPGVRGIGEKTAIELILNFGSIENLYKEIEQDLEKSKEMSPRIKELLLSNKENAFLSKKLSQLELSVPISFDLKQCYWIDYNKEAAKQLLEKYEFFSLIPRLPGQEEKKPEIKNPTLF